MSEPKLSDVLHVLRNPYGWSQEAIRSAQLKACDMLEAAAALESIATQEWIPVGELGEDESDAADAARFRMVPKMLLAIIWRHPNPLLGDTKNGFGIEELRVWADAAIKDAALPPPPAADK